MAKRAPHTPGPWHVAGYGILGPEARLKDSVAVTSVRARNFLGVSKFDDQERVANAHLIAAAPELLEAALAMLWYFQEGRDQTIGISKLRAAIAKAEGR